MLKTIAIITVFLTMTSLQAGKFDPKKALPDPDGKEANMSKPVQVFILMGQSNMLGFGKVNGGDGSLDNAVKNKKLYPYLIDSKGNWTVRKDVRNVRVMNFKDFTNDWMTIGKSNIGPEIGIGHYVGQVMDAPVMILKSCIGNRSLGWDLLPPGTKPYQAGGKLQPGYRGTPNNPKGNGEKVAGEWYAGKQYDDDTESAKKVLENLSKYYPGAKKYKIAGFCFWQGAKDGGNPAHAEAYEKNLVQFIKALRKDFNAPKAPFVIATMGHGKKGGGGNAGKITDAQLAVDGKTGKHKEFKGNVATFYSNPVSKGGSANSHYGSNAETYMNVGEGMGKAMATLLVNSGAGSSSGGSGYSGYSGDGFALCKKESDYLKKGKTYSYVLNLLDKVASKSDDKAKEASAFAKELREHIVDQNKGILEQADTMPAQTLMSMKSHLKIIKGTEGEDDLKAKEKELKGIKNINSLVSLLKQIDGMNATIAKRGSSKYTDSKKTRIIKNLKKFIDKKGVEEILVEEAKSVLGSLEG
jgi:hypothetical protein